MPGQLAISFVRMIVPPRIALITSVSSFNRPAYIAPENPDPPPPMMIRSYSFISIIQKKSLKAERLLHGLFVVTDDYLSVDVNDRDAGLVAFVLHLFRVFRILFHVAVLEFHAVLCQPFLGLGAPGAPLGGVYNHFMFCHRWITALATAFRI